MVSEEDPHHMPQSIYLYIASLDVFSVTPGLTNSAGRIRSAGRAAQRR